MGLVGEAGAAVLQLGDPGLRIGRRGPVPIRQPLALTLAVEPDQVLGRGRRDPALLGEALQHLAVAIDASGIDPVRVPSMFNSLEVKVLYPV